MVMKAINYRCKTVILAIIYDSVSFLVIFKSYWR